MRLALALTLAALAFGATPAGQAATSRPVRAVPDLLAHEATAYVAAGKTPGLAVAEIRCGRERFVTVGSAGRTRVDSRTVFEIGSLSKVLTGLLLAQVVSEGRASLDDDVRRYLPPGYGNLAWSDGAPVRLGHLVDTTSGLPDYLPDPAPIAKLPADAQIDAAARLLAGYSDGAFLHDLAQVSLLAKPGTAAHHSNVAAQLLGHIVGRLDGGSYAAVLRRRLELPNAMRDGTAMPQPARAAVGHDGDGKPTPAFTGESVMAAGGLRYSARDMARLLRLELTPAKNSAVRLSQVVRAEGPDGPIAFTWVTSEPRPGVIRYRLSGGTFGFSSYMEFYPSLDYGVVLLANRGGGDVQDELKAIAERSFDGARAKPCRPR